MAAKEKKDATLIIKVDLDCKCCYKKMWKILCKLQEKEKVQFTSTFDEKNKTVTVTGPFDPQAIIQKIKCMACKYKVIVDIQIKVDKPPPPPPPPPVVCEGDKKLTVKVEPKISVGAAACCHAQGGHQYGGSCGGGGGGKTTSECCGGGGYSSGCGGGKTTSECCGGGRTTTSECGGCTSYQYSCSCGNSSSGSGCSFGGHNMGACGRPPCKYFWEDNGPNPSCRIM